MRVKADMMTSLFSLRNFSYFLYAVILLTVLLYVRFPTDKFKVFCEKQIEYYLHVDKCTIETIKYRFPFTLVFKNINSEKTDSNQTNTTTVDEITIVVKAKTLGREFDVRGSLYGGTFQSELKIDHKEKIFILDSITISGVKLNLLMDSLQLSERKAQGEINYTGIYKAPIDAPFDGSGSGKVSVLDGSFYLSQSILGLSEINFKNIGFQISQDQDLIKLDAGILISDQFKSVFTGEITAKNFLPDSRLRLKGTLDPSRKLYKSNPNAQKYAKRLLRRYNMKELPFRVGGTFKIPTFRFGR